MSYDQVPDEETHIVWKNRYQGLSAILQGDLVSLRGALAANTNIPKGYAAKMEDTLRECELSLLELMLYNPELTQEQGDRIMTSGTLPNGELNEMVGSISAANLGVFVGMGIRGVVPAEKMITRYSEIVLNSLPFNDMQTAVMETHVAVQMHLLDLGLLTPSNIGR